ncbi:hypothetical protein U9M48_035482 [Paspalum notatum var. saurae]|uniref:CCHC-type domain-containing protein n=1 Tax=Paspalum notatum var. saurae TaxID=547442 RepID=A0AAQ3X8F9_PASNO
MGRLEKDFGDVSLVKVHSLVNRFLSTKMCEGNFVNEHINKLYVLAEELKIAGYPFQEEVQVMVVLNSLPDSWEQFKMSFCHSERAFNMRNLRHHLLLDEDRKLSQGKNKSSNNSELHLGEERYNNGNKKGWQKRKAKGDLRDKLNKKRDRDNHGNYDTYQRNDNNKKNFACHNCGKTGHFRADCRKKKYNEKKKPDSQDNSNRDPSKEGTHFIYVCTESLFTTTFPNSWVVDSSSTSHIARDHKSFTSMQTIPKGNRYVYLGTNAKADILGIGNYVLKLFGGRKLLLNDTLYSPSMRRNLISVSQLESIGYDIPFGKGNVKILLDEKLVHTGVQHDGLYFLDDLLEDGNSNCLVGEDNSIPLAIVHSDICGEMSTPTMFILSHSLMIILDLVMCIFLNTNQKVLMFSRDLKLKWKIR